MTSGGINTCSPSSLQILQKLAHPKKPCTSGAPLIKPPQRPPNKHVVSVACTRQIKQQSPPAIATQALTDTFDIEFQALEGCRLGISRYPDFEYNAQGGRGVGTGRGAKEGSGTDDTILVDFNVASLYIPAISGATTKFLGLPLPPFLKIEILPEVLRGSIDRASGQNKRCRGLKIDRHNRIVTYLGRNMTSTKRMFMQVDLQFQSKFCFSVGSLYQAPPLFVATTLTSEKSSGTIRRGTGERLDGEGKCKLVGVAVVDPIDDVFMNTFLGLPTECIAYLNVTMYITSST